MSDDSNMLMIGRTETVVFPQLDYIAVPARVDTGAKTSAIWASGIIEGKGTLQCVLFGPDSALYTGKVLNFNEYGTKTIVSSNGLSEQRYVVKLVVNIKGRQIKASFTLANRSKQVYPILIGRNILLGKFVVDVKQVSGTIDNQIQLPQRPNRPKHKSRLEGGA